MIGLDAQRGRVQLRMTALLLGSDLCVTLSGGDRPHIGAVALSGPNGPSSALALPEHREGELARDIASRLASEFNVAACIACGVHLDGILPGEIQDVLEMADELTRELIDRLEAMSPWTTGNT